MLSERSERRDEAHAEIGDAPLRRVIASELAIDPERVMIAPSVAAIELALFYVLADAGDEVLVSSSDTRTTEAATISGLDAVPIPSLDDLFEVAGERTRALVIDAAELDEERLAIASEIDLPILCRGVRPGLANDAEAPLVVTMAERGGVAWLAAFGAADRAEPLVARLLRFQSVFFARASAP